MNMKADLVRERSVWWEIKGHTRTMLLSVTVTQIPASEEWPLRGRVETTVYGLDQVISGQEHGWLRG